MSSKAYASLHTFTTNQAIFTLDESYLSHHPLKARKLCILHPKHWQHRNKKLLKLICSNDRLFMDFDKQYKNIAPKVLAQSPARTEQSQQTWPLYALSTELSFGHRDPRRPAAGYASARNRIGTKPRNNARRAASGWPIFKFPFRRQLRGGEVGEKRAGGAGPISHCGKSERPPRLVAAVEPAAIGGRWRARKCKARLSPRPTSASACPARPTLARHFLSPWPWADRRSPRKHARRDAAPAAPTEPANARGATLRAGFRRFIVAGDDGAADR